MKTGETSYKETSFGIIPRTRLVKLEAEGIERGIKFLYAESKSLKSKVTFQLILELHNRSFGWIFPQWAGKFRTIQVEYSEKEAPPYHQVAQLVTDLCLDLKERLKHLPKIGDDNFLKQLSGLLAWFQYRFVFIHPFNDYNGRTARMLTSFICFLVQFPPIEIKVDRGAGRKRYISAMKMADKGNLEKLERIIFTALSEDILNV